jgi:subtilisin family serine protease
MRERASTALLLAVTLFAPAQAHARPAPPPRAEDEILVRFRPSVPGHRVREIHAQHHATVKREHRKLRFQTVKLSAGTGVDDAVRAYARLPEVESAEPNWIAHALGVPNDPSFGMQWGLRNTGQTYGTAGADVRAEDAWDVTTGDPSVVVAVLDTGVSIRHPDLAGQLWTNPGEIPDNQVDDDGNGYVDDVYGWDFSAHNNRPDDYHGHVTHVASIIAARANDGVGVSGVAPGVRLMAVEVLDNIGQGYFDAIADGIVYAADNGARIISMSLGGTADGQVLRDAIRYAHDAGVAIVVAAGNEYGPPVLYPAAYDPWVLAVAATDHDDARAEFSSAGTAVDVAAPGKDVYAAWRLREIGPERVRFIWAFASGTSMATPLTSGIAALVASRHPTLTNDQLLDRVKYTADERNAALYPGEDEYMGFGRVNAYRALTEAPRPVLTVRSQSIDDSAGNGDGRADPGELVRVALTLANAWSDAPTVSATLSSADPCVAVVGASASFGAIPAGGVASNAGAPFGIQISAGCAPGRKVALSLTVSAGGVPMTLPLALTIGRPPILFVSDDGDYGWRLYYTDALDALGLAYDVWDVPFDADGPPASELDGYRVVVWDAIEASLPGGGATLISNTLSSADVAALRTYLDGGGALLLAAGDVTDGWDLAPELLDFLTTYMHTSLTTPLAGQSIAGTVGGPFAGEHLEINGGGELTYLDPDPLAASLFADDAVSSSWYGRSVATLYPASGAAPYRAVYLGFDLHRIASADARRFVLGRSLELLLDQPLSAAPNLVPLCRTGGYWYADDDENGSERVALDGTASADPERTALAFAWREGTSLVAKASTATVRMGLGPHYLTLTCTDAKGGSARRAVVAQVDPPLPANGGPSIAAVPAGPAQAVTGVLAAFSTQTTDPDGDGVYYDFEWRGESAFEIETTTQTQLYPSGAAVAVGHAFPKAGVYTVRARAFDVMGEKLNGLDCFSKPATVTVCDAGAPVISDVRIAQVGATSAVVTWTTDRPATSVVSYGTDRPLWMAARDEALVTSHVVTLAGLPSNRTHFVDVRSAGTSGAVAVDRNGGAYHRFVTLPAASLMHVEDVAVALVVDRYTYATATVTVVDQDGRPVPGATVMGTWVGSAHDSDAGVTDASGRITLVSDKTRGAIARASTYYAFQVEGVALAGWTYEVSANEETADVAQPQ